LRLELPAEAELQRLVNAALNGYFYDLYEQMTAQLPLKVQTQLDELLVVPPDGVISPFESLKADAANPGVNNLEREISKLKTLRALGVPPEAFRSIPWKVLQMLKRRAWNEKASEMREHPQGVRYALIATFVHVRLAEVIDDVVKMLVEIIQRLDRRSDQQVYRELLRDLQRVEGKIQILFRVAEVVITKPEGTIREVLFPVVKEETFHQLAVESRNTGPQFRLFRQALMRRKFVRHYRRMLPLVLEILHFRSDNRFQPIVEALSAIQEALTTRSRYFKAPVPIQGVVPRGWTEHVFEEVKGEAKVNRHYYELCVLQQLQRALKCKEIWVEGAHAFRNPNDDLPADWDNVGRRIAHYEKLGLPVEADHFVENLRGRMTAALHEFDRILPRQSHLRIYCPNKSRPDRGLFAVAKLERQKEPNSLDLIKDGIVKDFGMLDLLDIFVEADRLVDFTRFFIHSGTKEVRSREALRPLLILDLFAEGTNMGIKRLANSNDRYSYEELLYVRKMYFSPEALRNANAAVVNKVLEIRNPRIWGEGHACASDGKRFPSWSQNLMSEWRSRYHGDGVLVYWHVETGAVCIYSQLRSFSSSEVAAMIEGLVRHDTEMRVEKNFVDSHGQSEVAFAFCHLLGTVRLMPRLKRIKYERLYLPAKGIAGKFLNLIGVLTRPIRWDLITQQYDEMVKAAVALKDGTATAEAILRRFNSYNVTHPTYKALAEVGKAEKTIFLCDYLSSRETQYEVNDGLQVVENWNSTNEFICYGRQGELATNSREQQEATTLSLQLLQNCLMLINTILIQRTIDRQGLWARLQPEDFRALTPLFYGHINPYGLFELDLEGPSFLEAA
jgi:TnpA family transposase